MEILGLILSLVVGAGLTAYNIGNTEWEKNTWQETKEREDNAVQRRAADLEAAGINPLLAAGQPAQATGAPSPNQVDASPIMEGALGDMMKGTLKKARLEAEGMQIANDSAKETLTKQKFENKYMMDDRTRKIENELSETQRRDAVVAIARAVEGRNKQQFERYWNSVKDMSVFQEAQGETQALLDELGIEPNSFWGRVISVIMILRPSGIGPVHFGP